MYKAAREFLGKVVEYPKKLFLARDVDKRVESLLKDYENNTVTNIANQLSKVNGVDGRLLVLLNLNQIDCERLHNQLKEEWDNIYLQNFLEELFDVLLSYGEISKTPQEAYRYYIHVNNILGTGVQGVVSAGLFGTCKDSLFAIKNTKSKDNRDLIREFVVGRELSSLNNPVFTRIYSIFPCSRALDVDKKVISFCQTGEQYTIGFQLLQGKTLSDTQLTTSQFEIVFIILLSALYQASQIEFTHHDLHNENVFIRKLDTPMLVPVSIPGVDIEYVLTEYFPFILDYGLARVNTRYGPILPDGYQNFGIRDEYVPMYDIYKLLFFTLRDQPYLGIEHLFRNLENDLTPYNSRDFVKTLSKGNEYFIVPEFLRGMSIDDYAAGIMEHIEKHAFMGEFEDYQIIGEYTEEDYFRSYNLLNKTLSNSDVTDKVLLDFKYPIKGNTTVKSSSYVEFYADMMRKIIAKLERLTPQLNSMSNEEFELHYFQLTDMYRTVHDGIHRYAQRTAHDKRVRDAATYEKRVKMYGYKKAQEEPFDAMGHDGFEIVNKDRLIETFNKIGKILIIWDKKLKSLIDQKKIPDVKNAIFKVREIKI